MGPPTTRGALMKCIKIILRYICTSKPKKVEFTKKSTQQCKPFPCGDDEETQARVNI